MSQLDLALDAEISQKHLSFIESGRSRPSRGMVLRLAERLHVPLRERNALLLAAGYAPNFPERALDDPALKTARAAVDLVLKAHEPFPALALDRHWSIVASNAALAPLLAGVADRALLEPPVNVLRLALHPEGLASHIVNLAELRGHFFERLRRQIDATADPILMRLMAELVLYPTPSEGAPGSSMHDYGGVVTPLDLITAHGRLSLFSTITMFGTPLDITLSELSVEAFFPADAQTAEILRRLA